MNLQEIIRGVFHVTFSSQQNLTETFLRFQEHYESPEFRGKIFTLEEYKQWYTANSKKGKETGRFTYYEDWKGFNIPSEILNPFYQGKFDPLSEKEKILLNTFRDKTGKFYIIGTSGEVDMSTLKHEVAHGLFYTNQEYRTTVLSILGEIETSEMDNIRTILVSTGGYHPSVCDDETHAYIFCNLINLERKGSIDKNKLANAIKKLEANFDRFSNGLFDKKAE